jgi:hypothetical protein
MPGTSLAIATPTESKSSYFVATLKGKAKLGLKLPSDVPDCIQGSYPTHCRRASRGWVTLVKRKRGHKCTHTVGDIIDHSLHGTRRRDRNEQ